jgi:hypothetical protein
MSSLEIEIPIQELIVYKAAGIDRILAELIQAGGSKLRSQIHKLMNSIWNKE